MLHHINHFLHNIGGLGVGRVDQQFIPMLAARIEQTFLHINDVVGVWVIVDITDAVRAGAGQISRGRIRLIVQLGNGGCDFIQRGFFHRRLVIHHPRHRLD